MLLFTLLSVLLILAGFVLAAQGFRNLEMRYTLDRFRAERIDRITPGLVEVTATVASGDDTLTAPISGAECVCYEIVVEEEHQYAEEPEWSVSSLGRNGVPFYLEDEGGSILVDPYGADLDLPARHVERVPPGVVPPDPIRSTGEDLPENDPDLAEQLDLNLFTCQTDRDTRFLEYYVAPGDQLTVFGRGMERAEGRNAFYDDRDTLLLHRDPSTPAFLLSDEPGRVDLSSSLSVTSWFLGAGGLFVAGLLALAAGV